MSEVRCEIDQLGTRLVARLAGDLTLTTASAVRRNLLTCLVEQPDALVVDVSDLAVREPTAVSVFTSVARQAAVWPGTPLLVCAPGPQAAGLSGTGRWGRLPVFDSVDRALAVDPVRRLPAVREVLLPVGGAARRARELVADACRRWELPAAAHPGCAVASELVANAAVHARTMTDLRLSLRGDSLMIAVGDGSTAAPRITTSPGRGGYGLRLVAATTPRWGWLRTDGGKVVWAVLDAHRAQ